MPIMEKLKELKIKELAEKKFNVVELLYVEENKNYLVCWKWSTMKVKLIKEYNTLEDAMTKYKERIKFIIDCYEH